MVGFMVLSPVSYTHLDVYKRQAWSGATVHKALADEQRQKHQRSVAPKGQPQAVVLHKQSRDQGCKAKTDGAAHPHTAVHVLLPCQHRQGRAVGKRSDRCCEEGVHHDQQDDLAKGAGQGKDSAPAIATTRARLITSLCRRVESATPVHNLSLIHI